MHTSHYDPRALAEFARYYGFHYDICDPPTLVRDIRIEMERGLAGESSTLPMIPSYLRPQARPPRDKAVVALDAGGTNLRSALVRFDAQGKPHVGESRKAPMPGTRGRAGAAAFFDAIAELTLPFLIEEREEKCEGIGFCFSYPMEITRDGDAVLLALSKEVDAPEVIGRTIGAGLREALERRGVRAPGRIVLLNDTAATLLSGMAALPERDFDGEDRRGVPGGPVIGFILGTGLNTAYPESRIPKIGFDDPASPQIVVCETGNYHPRYLGVLDREFDETTKNPGTYGLEKAAAGAYLGPFTLSVLKRAVRSGLLRLRRSEELLKMPTLQTRDLNAFLCAPLAEAASSAGFASLFDGDELDAIRSCCCLASIVTRRGALFSAAVLAAAAERMDAGRDPAAPLRIAVDGTTYKVYRGMRSALESYLQVMLNAESPRFYTIAPVEQASLLGAAVAAV